MEISSTKTARPLYQRNLIVLWIGNFITGIGLSLVNPFMPLFINTLGVFSRQELAFFSGIIIAAPFLMQAIISPVWGRLADRRGRKLMMLRASAGMSVFMVATGFVTNVWVLLLVRACFGLLSGFISNSIALMASQVPKEESGKVLGTLNTASVGGMLIGPVVGGTLVPLIGYAHVFWITGGLIALVFFSTLVLVKDEFTPVQKGAERTIREVFAKLDNTQIILGMFLTTLILTLTASSINPILSLYVRDIMGSKGNVEFWSGIASAAPGITTIIAAPRLGALGDRIGTHKILMFGLVLQIVVFLPMAIFANIGVLIALRLLLGIANASLMPSVQALLTRHTPKDATSRIFSYNQSAQSSGMVIGPLVGGAISGILAIHYVFFATMAFALLNLLNVLRVSRHNGKEV